MEKDGISRLFKHSKNFAFLSGARAGEIYPTCASFKQVRWKQTPEEAEAIIGRKDVSVTCSKVSRTFPDGWSMGDYKYEIEAVDGSVSFEIPRDGTVTRETLVRDIEQRLGQRGLTIVLEDECRIHEVE